MVMAKLHIICGSCGCNDDFEYRNYVNFCELEGVNTGSSITCKNCSTIHSLNGNAELKEFTKPVKVKPLVWQPKIRVNGKWEIHCEPCCVPIHIGGHNACNSAWVHIYNISTSHYNSLEDAMEAAQKRYEGIILGSLA